MKQGIKYCGGCNSRYDRAKIVQILEKQLGTSLLSAKTNEEYDVIYVICGCTARCADISSLNAKQFVLIDHPDALYKSNILRQEE